jgi:exopolyphosphatase/guanosine-5'-triphosphate,3'-diphosphate pyrophosphatase
VDTVSDDDVGPRPVAAIDVGSSAIRLLVAEVRPDGSTRTLETASRGVRLGRDAFLSGGLGARTIEAACEALVDFRRILDELGVTDVRAVATSAVRESGNRDTFLDRIAMRTDLDVEVLEPEEETRLTCLAVQNALEGRKELEESLLIAEIGGGSAALAMLTQGVPAHSGTYALGAVRLRQILSGLGGGHRAWVDALRSHIKNVIRDIRGEIPLKKVRHVAGLGGDMRFAADRIAGRDDDAPVRVLERQAFLDFTRRIALMPVERVAARLRMPLANAETLGPALLVNRELVRATPAEHVLVPRVSLRDAVLADLALRVRGRDETGRRRQILASAEALAARYRADLRHARRVAAFAERLFDDLRPVHRLGETEKTWLMAAALVHDIGLFVSLRAHHKHSEYLILASQIFGLRRDEREIVACVARYHRRAMPRPTHGNYTSLDRDGRLAVSKLGAILRMANSLDQDHKGRIEEVRARAAGDRWIVEVETTGDLDLHRLSLKRRADLFREVFGLDVELRSGITP